MDTLESYAGFLRGNAPELGRALYSDALIGVTSFFRNAEAFALLQHQVFPRLLERGGHDPLRIWVLGCSTGQEAYSLAMAFAEASGKFPRARKLQVFATDLNDANLEKARDGFYAKTLAQDVSPERLRRFFVEEEGGYRVIKSLREQVVFACQNVISDPPFSRMDLISCRNLMIYLEPQLQKRVLPTFHYALKPGGFLFLGASESIGGFADFFAPVDKKQKIFVRKAAPTLAFHLPIRNGGAGRAPTATDPGVPPPGDGNRQRRGRPAERTQRRTGGGPGDDQPFAPAGRPHQRRAADPAIPGLDRPVSRAAHGQGDPPPAENGARGTDAAAARPSTAPSRKTRRRARKTWRSRRGRGPGWCMWRSSRSSICRSDASWSCLRMRSGRRSPTQANPRGPPGPGQRPGSRARQQAESRRVAGLEQDLSETRDYLQSIQEHQESANEELQASNEEGQSANEELQSLNEELETSKEELESTNEELTTVNEEMVTRNTELHRLNGELGAAQGHAEAIIRTVAVPLVILTSDLRVQSVNEAFSQARSSSRRPR